MWVYSLPKKNHGFRWTGVFFVWTGGWSITVQLGNMQNHWTLISRKSWNINMRKYMKQLENIRTYVYIYTYIYMYIYMYVCIYVYILWKYEIACGTRIRLAGNHGTSLGGFVRAGKRIQLGEFPIPCLIPGNTCSICLGFSILWLWTTTSCWHHKSTRLQFQIAAPMANNSYMCTSHANVGGYSLVIRHRYAKSCLISKSIN